MESAPPDTIDHLIGRLRPGRRITGMSAVLLPFDQHGEVDWSSFESHLGRTVEAGLTPAVNMDTGYVSLLDDTTRTAVLDRAAAVGVAFVAGAYVHDEPGAQFDRDAYLRQIEPIVAAGGTPVIFPSFGLSGLAGPDWVAAHDSLAAAVDRFIAFELSPRFLPSGRIYDIATYEGLLGIHACIGAKHSSLSRPAEWERLAARDRLRPEFLVLTGNDLAIDMVMYGSDYLLGLSSFAPDLFARRDAYWEAGDARFFELNDALQYLGAFSFRNPVPAYKHDCAMFCALRGWIAHDNVAPGSPRRPDSDRDVLAGILERLEELA